MSEIKERYGPGTIVTRFITDGAPELLAAVERTERRLAGVITSAIDTHVQGEKHGDGDGEDGAGGVLVPAG